MAFRLSTKGHYALLLMCELARSKKHLPLSEVSKNRNVSRGYLEQIVRPLRESNLVTGKRGAYGGYALSRDAQNITVGEVIRVVEGPVLPAECAGEDHDPLNCPPDCEAKQVWQKVRHAIDHVLDSITLESLILGDTGVGRSSNE